MHKFNFGPLVCGTKISKELAEELLLVGRMQTEDATKDLAGRIEDEKNFDEESKMKFSRQILPHIEEYLGNIVEFKRWSPNRQPILEMEKLWINFQKSGEYNPPHVHTGLVSFVIYLQIPEGMYEEAHNTLGPPPGTISFSFGDSTFVSDEKDDDRIFKELLQPVTYLNFAPDPLDMFIFPSYLKHYVESFRSEGERISVSGNVLIKSI